MKIEFSLYLYIPPPTYSISDLLKQTEIKVTLEGKQTELLKLVTHIQKFRTTEEELLGLTVDKKREEGA